MKNIIASTTAIAPATITPRTALDMAPEGVGFMAPAVCSADLVVVIIWMRVLVDPSSLTESEVDVERERLPEEEEEEEEVTELVVEEELVEDEVEETLVVVVRELLEVTRAVRDVVVGVGVEPAGGGLLRLSGGCLMGDTWNSRGG